VVIKDAIRYLPEDTEGEIGAVRSKALLQVQKLAEMTGKTHEGERCNPFVITA
jgi:hypothetical protein